jgi:hypothetical protein
VIDLGEARHQFHLVIDAARAKTLMAIEALISYAVVILVISRAVNVLGTAT